MVRRTFRARTLAATVLALAAGSAPLFVAGTARADGPSAQEGPDPQAMDELHKISLRISKSLKENEEALARLARGEQGTPKKVDIEIPPSDRKPETSPAPSPSSPGLRALPQSPRVE